MRRNLTRRALPPRMINGIFSIYNELRNGHKGIPLLQQGLQNGGKRFRGMESRVMEQDDGARLDL